MKIIYSMICCLIVTSTVTIYTMELSTQSRMKQRLEYESTIIKNVITFLEKIGSEESSSEDESRSDEEIEQVLGTSVDPAEKAAGQLNAFSRSLLQYQNFYDTDYSASPALKEISDTIAIYVLELQHYVRSGKALRKSYAVLIRDLCGSVKHYLEGQEYNVKAQLYNKLSSKQLFENVEKEQSIDMVNTLHSSMVQLIAKLNRKMKNDPFQLLLKQAQAL